MMGFRYSVPRQRSSVRSRTDLRSGILGLFLLLVLPVTRGASVELDPPQTPAGYLSLLLINEVPFPGERFYRSEADTQAAMLSVLWVLHSRTRRIPPGYTQQQVAGIRSDNLLEVMTAPGQLDGFSRTADGRYVTAPRVRERVDYLIRTANTGEPGRFARLLDYAKTLARSYFASGRPEASDLFARLREIGPVNVTGGGYSWMTDINSFHPGGRFVRIPDDQRGSLGGNRFFTLKQTP